MCCGLVHVQFRCPAHPSMYQWAPPEDIPQGLHHVGRIAAKSRASLQDRRVRRRQRRAPHSRFLVVTTLFLCFYFFFHSPTGTASRSWWPAGSPTAWAWSSSKATAASPSPTPSGTSSWPSGPASTTMPSGGTSTGPARWRPKGPDRCLKDAARLSGDMGTWKGGRGREPGLWARPHCPCGYRQKSLKVDFKQIFFFF